MAEHRLLELRRRCGLESRLVVVLMADSLEDGGAFAGGAALLTRLHKHVREYAHGYYLAQVR